MLCLSRGRSLRSHEIIEFVNAIRETSVWVLCASILTKPLSSSLEIREKIYRPNDCTRSGRSTRTLDISDRCVFFFLFFLRFDYSFEAKRNAYVYSFLKIVRIHSTHVICE